MFVVLDDLSSTSIEDVKKRNIQMCPRIEFVFLPVRSPDSTWIEVRWLWLQRQTISNSTFRRTRNRTSR